MIRHARRSCSTPARALQGVRAQSRRVRCQYAGAERVHCRADHDAAARSAPPGRSRPAARASDRWYGRRARPEVRPSVRSLDRALLTSSDTGVRLAAARRLVPCDVPLGGWAALAWLGVTALDGRTGPGGSTLVLSRSAPGRWDAARTGLAVDRSTLMAVDIVEHDGALATTAERSCLDVMRFFGAEEGLVAADAAVRAGLTTRERLAEALNRMVGLQGRPAGADRGAAGRRPSRVGSGEPVSLRLGRRGRPAGAAGQPDRRETETAGPSRASTCWTPRRQPWASTTAGTTGTCSNTRPTTCARRPSSNSTSRSPDRTALDLWLAPAVARGPADGGTSAWTWAGTAARTAGPASRLSRRRAPNRPARVVCDVWRSDTPVAPAVRRPTRRKRSCAGRGGNGGDSGQYGVK